MLQLDGLLRMALQEDLGHGDVTSLAVVDDNLAAEATVIAREPLVLSGTFPFSRVFGLLDPAVCVQPSFEDGAKIEKEVNFIRITGSARSLLAGERTALNLLQRLCGIATLTRRMAEAIAGTKCRLLDTRKTTPLWRLLEKKAVRHGGGSNHRFGLSDGILIKDNHVAAAGGVAKAVERARAHAPHGLKVEVEVDTLEQLEEGLRAGADIVLLDNFSLDMIREAVSRADGRCLLEVSGGVTLENVRAIAETGVDFVSSGALTHSARAMDISMELHLH
ncbi:MAG: carboxylating nicotinate-nucleotide diphosphorylase [Syntrophobacteraceae bacterium]